jgi:hypothetical protein
VSEKSRAFTLFFAVAIFMSLVLSPSIAGHEQALTVTQRQDWCEISIPVVSLQWALDSLDLSIESPPWKYRDVDDYRRMHHGRISDLAAFRNVLQRHLDEIESVETILLDSVAGFCRGRDYLLLSGIRHTMEGLDSLVVFYRRAATLDSSAIIEYLGAWRGAYLAAQSIGVELDSVYARFRPYSDSYRSDELLLEDAEAMFRLQQLPEWWYAFHLNNELMRRIVWSDHGLILFYQGLDEINAFIDYCLLDLGFPVDPCQGLR